MASLARRTLGHRLAASQFIRPATPRASAYAYASVRYQSDDAPTNSSVSKAPTNSSFSKAKPTQAIQSIQKTGLNDAPLMLEDGARDWSKSYHGLSVEPFAKEVADILMETPGPEDVELKPDGIIYLPEIKYRRILNRAFGPGGWGLAPRSETIVTDKSVTREYALVCHGRLIAIARGEQDYYDPSGIPTATEGCKSNALMRCCKDLGIASELWDPRFIKDFKKKYGEEKFAEHALTKKKKKLWVRKGEQLEYPWKATSGSGGYGN